MKKESKKNFITSKQITAYNQVIKKQSPSLSQNSSFNYNKEINNSNMLNIGSNNQLISKMNQNMQNEEIDQDFKLDFTQTKCNSRSYIDEQDNLAKNQVIIKYELLQGESEFSNIFKVTVKDFGIGMSQEKILKILQIINTKNTEFSAEYQNNSFLGWKINYHIIGNLGPFYNFFVKSQENKGLEYHFYIFQDIMILREDKPKQQIIFKNLQFDISLEHSNNYFYNINKIEELKDQVYKSSNLINQKIQIFSDRSLIEQNHKNLLHENQLIQNKTLNSNSEIRNQNTESLIQNQPKVEQFHKFIKDIVKPENKFQVRENN
ncbi:hypothetical protein ABPG74_008762 [Tetrahymena malaccensis]